MKRIMSEHEKNLFNVVDSLMDKAEEGSYAAKIELHRIITQHGAAEIKRLYDLAILEATA